MRSYTLATRRVAASLLGLTGLALLVFATVEQGGKTERAPEGFGKEAAADSPDEARKFRRLQLQDENGHIPIDGLQKAREHVAAMRAEQDKRAKAAGKTNGIEVAGITPGSWNWLGPGNVGGRIRSIAIDPANPNNMWVGSVSGGIWHSIDAGSSWAPVNDFMANLAVSTIVIDPTNSNIMYAGTGEAFAAGLNAQEGEGFVSDDGLRGIGVFKSTDGGVTWNQLPNTNPASTTVCAAGGINCPWSYVNRLAISTGGSTILAATITGIQRSTDGGATWNPGAGVIGNILDIDFDPNNPQQAIASGGAASLFSTDAGQSWTFAVFTPAISGRVEVAYAPSSPNIVYASVDKNKGEVYRSTDGGQNFARVNTGTNYFVATPTGTNDQGGYDNIVWVNPTDPTFVIVGGIDLWRSTDSGANFTKISQWQCGPGQTNSCAGQSAHADQHMVVAHPGFNGTSNRIVYFSNDGGLFRADDVNTVEQTAGWTNLNYTLGITQFYGAAGNPFVIIGGTQDNSTVRFTGDLSNWSTTFGGDGGYCAADQTDSNYLYGEYPALQIFRSTDRGATAGLVDCNPPHQTGGNGCVAPATGITDNGQANFIAPFILDPSEPNRMLAGSLSLWRSNDIKASGLPTWTAIKAPAADTRPPPLFGQVNAISAIAVSPNNSDFIVVGHDDGQIYLTFDGTGINPPSSPAWSRISNGTPARFVTRLAIDETRSPNWIYATFGGFSNNNVYVTKDLGATWTDVSGVKDSTTDLPAVPVRSLVISPVQRDFLYVGTEVGVFASEDAGATWKVPPDGPANVSVDELFWLNGNLVAVTHGRGLFSTANVVYNFPVCAVPEGGCPCFGDWDCACTWNNKQVPTANDDVYIYCPVTVAAGQARNIRVENRLTIGGGLGVTGDVFNAGYIVSSPGAQSNLACRNLINIKPPHVLTYQGTIELLGGISASGDVTNSGVIALGTNFDSNNLTTSPGSTLTFGNAHVSGNVYNYGLMEALGTQSTISVSGDIDNGGSLKGAILVTRAPASRLKNFSGAGLWQFTNLLIPQGYMVKLTSDVTFDIASFNNSGTLDFSDNTLTFTGSSFENGGTAGTGTLRLVPSSGSATFNGNGPAVTIASGTVEYQSGGTFTGLFLSTREQPLP